MRSPKAKQEQRKQRAEARAELKYTPEEHLSRLVARGHGHCAEARKLRGEE